MNKNLAIIATLTAALAVTPLAPAQAGWHHGYGGHGGGHGIGLIGGVVAVGAAVTGAAVAIATLPFRAVADATAPEPAAYYPQPAPAPAYYNYQPAYQPRQVVVYSYPPAYAYPTPYGYPPQ